MSIILLDDLTKKYGEYMAVKRLNLTIEQGEIFGLLGPNGAGKTTTILMMLGLSEPTSGSVSVCGINSTRNPIEVKQKVGYLPDDIGFYDDRTGLENIIFTGKLNGLSPSEAKERGEALLYKVGLENAAHKKVATYSRGMRQRLGLADVLIKKPEVIILDEPTLGIDPEGVRSLLQLIRSLSKEEGLTVLLSSHHLHQVQQVCDRVGLFVQGEVIALGQIEELAKQMFKDEPIHIYVRVASTEKDKVEQVVCEIKQMEEVKLVEENTGTIHIECYEDVTKAITKLIFTAGLELEHLSKQEYGLDEVYHRYFQESTAMDRGNIDEFNTA